MSILNALRSARRVFFLSRQGKIARQGMFDAKKLSDARWAVRDILQYLKSNHRVKRTLVEKAVRRLNEVGFEESASMLEAEFRPVFQGKKMTTELSSSIQSLYQGIDAAISVRLNDMAATKLKPVEPLKTGSPTGAETKSSSKQSEQTAGATSIGSTGSSGLTSSDALNLESSIESDDKLPKKLRKDSPSRVKAKAAYEYAMGQIPNADQMTAVELFNALCEQGKANDMLPPTSESFTRYLNDCGIRLRKSDAKPDGSSIVRRSDM